MAATQQLQREQANREAAEFIQKTAHDPGYYTSGQAQRDQRDQVIKQAAYTSATYGGPGADYYIQYGYLKPSEAGTYNASYQQAKQAYQTPNANPSQQVRMANTQQIRPGY
jgi:hypothetical protein